MYKAFGRLTKADVLSSENSIQFWGFLQLNVGIIAATIPTLKPLLKKAGLSTSGDRYNQFDRQAQNTIGSGMKTPRSRMLYSNTMHAETDQLGYEMTKGFNTSIRGGITPVYSNHNERSGSEDTILEQAIVEPRGIKRTTKVVIGEAR